MIKRAYTFILITVIFAAAIAVAICLYEKNEQKPHVHDYTATAIPNTCEEDGYTIFTCSCKETYTVKGLAKKGHQFVNYVSNNDADYYKDGTKTANCENGCGKKDTQQDVGSKLKSQIIFNSLVFDDKVCELSVSNACIQFSFLSEITIVGDAEYQVYSDTALGQVLGNVVSIDVGKNYFYIKVEVSGVVEVYTLCVARKALYTVSFDLDCELTMPPVTVEEGGILPNQTVPERAGYTFVGWNYDLTKPVRQDFTAKATWNKNSPPEEDGDEPPTGGGENIETPPEIIYADYKVEYYLENLNGEYALNEAETVYGQDEVGKQVFAPQKTFEHFSVVNASVSDTVGQDNNTVLKVYYDRSTYTVQFNGLGGQLVSGEEIQTIKYEKAATAPIYKRAGYEFKGFSGAFDSISCDTEISAVWELVDYNISYILNGGSNSNANPSTYTVESQDITLIAPSYTDFEFLGWFDDNGNEVSKIENSAYGDIVLTAKWKSNIFEIDGDTIVGLTDAGVEIYELILISELNGQTITKIADGAFKNNVNLVSIEIPKSITRIGFNAYNGCSNLVYLIFEETEGWTHNGTNVSPTFIKSFANTNMSLFRGFYGEWVRE